MRAGKFKRAGRGPYSLSGAPVGEHRSLAGVSVRVPKGIVCLLSGLEVHEIDTQAPFQVRIAIPPNLVSPRLDRPAVRVVHMSLSD